MKLPWKAHEAGSQRTWSIWLSLAFAVGMAAVVALGDPIPSLSELQSALRARLEASRSGGGHWGMQVVSLETGTTLFETNAHLLFVPASNTKLFTAALALDRLGGDFRIKTSVLASARPDAEGTVHGELVILGRGDPTFSDRLHHGDWSRGFGPLAEAIAAAGIRRIDGDLVCDESYFRGPPFGSGWAWDDLAVSTGAATSALCANDNLMRFFIRANGAAVSVDSEFAGKSGDKGGTFPPGLIATPFLSLRNELKLGSTNSHARISVDRIPGERSGCLRGVIGRNSGVITQQVSVPVPAELFGHLLRQALSRRGVKVAGATRVKAASGAGSPARDYSEWLELAAVHSPTIGDLVRETQKPSQNLYAQLLLLQSGAETENYPRDNEVSRPRALTTEEAGLRALGDFLENNHLSLAEVRLEEGAGLSRKNLMSPAAAVQLLVFMDRHRWADAWRDALPVGGIDGTLKSRFQSGAAHGNVRAKTGTMANVTALSGYVRSTQGERLAFSILVNGCTGGATLVRSETDALVELLADFAGRSRD